LAHPREDACGAEGDKNSADCYYAESMPQEMRCHNPNDSNKSKCRNN
jgi:hypothetical protein